MTYGALNRTSDIVFETHEHPELTNIISEYDSMNITRKHKKSQYWTLLLTTNARPRLGSTADCYISLLIHSVEFSWLEVICSSRIAVQQELRAQWNMPSLFWYKGILRSSTRTTLQMWWQTSLTCTVTSDVFPEVFLTHNVVEWIFHRFSSWSLQILVESRHISWSFSHVPSATHWALYF